ncbi:MAG: multiheme c-type cytochrome [Acidobacteriota bacterium]
MDLKQKRWIIIGLAFLFLLSLLLVQWREVARRHEELGMTAPSFAVPATSQSCMDCHVETTPGIVDHWAGSKHAITGVGCYDCHRAEEGDVDGFDHYGLRVASVVTPLDCGRCHAEVAEEFQGSHHSAAGNILASLDNFLAETVEGGPPLFNPHSPTPGKMVESVNGHASAFLGCQQCHGSKVAFRTVDGGRVTVDDLKPDKAGHPTNAQAVARILRDPSGKPIFDAGTWPNTGIGRLNLDGSRGSCSACHSRHDFSPRRARQPENCGKCHLGPDHPQKEIFEESKHGVAYRDLKDEMNLAGESWVLGEDYSQAPTCATCHMSGHSRNGGRVTHDPGERISWTNRPPVSLVLDTDAEGHVVKATDPVERQALIADSAESKRNRMKAVCSHCHTPSYIDAFYQQYDDLVILYNEKFAKPGQAIMAALLDQGLRSETAFDEEIEWTWFYLWHHEGRRARHGASMMAPDYTHWHGMYEVAERFYMELIPQARELTEEGRGHGKGAGAAVVEGLISDILERPEHAWFEEGAEDDMRRIREAMEERYGQGES